MAHRRWCTTFDFNNNRRRSSIIGRRSGPRPQRSEHNMPQDRYGHATFAVTIGKSGKFAQAAVAGEVLSDEYHRSLYSTDASMYQIQPLAVVVPRSSDDVAACLAIAAEHRVPLIARGSGTSLSGQSIGAGIVVDFSKYLNRIVELDPAACTAAHRAGRGAGSTERGRGAARLAIRPRRGHEQSRESRRHDRQQLGRLALDPAWQDGRSCDRAIRARRRRHAGDAPPAHARSIAGRASRAAIAGARFIARSRELLPRSATRSSPAFRRFCGA